MKQILWSLAIAGMWLSSVSMPVSAQVLDEGDAPDHGVARISVVNGDVSIRRGDSGELTAAATNGPIVTSDQLLTADGSRAEIQFDSFNMIRLAPSTEVRMGDLQDRRYLVQVAVGTATFRVMRENNAQVEISTPTVSVRPTQPGTYRVTVRPDGSTEITVRQGEAEIYSPRGSEVLRAGQTMQARGNASDPEYMIGAAIPQDEWDRWNIQRDQAFQQVTSSRYVSPDIYGTEELDSTGRWEYDEPYGNVWVPTVSAGWAPYREGRWVWVDYYGWTWLSEDPFGWAPYHYGSWYSGRYGWAWYPGAISSRYYWRPALVGFFGWGGGGVSVGFGYGNVGWVPLAPYERYRPWYGRGGNTNIFVTNIRNDYRNSRYNGVTSVRSNDFGRGGRINRNNFVRVSDRDLTQAGSVQGRVPFNASRESRNFSDRQVNAGRLPTVNQNTRFYSRGDTGGRGGNTRGSTQVGGGSTGRGSTQVGGGQAPGGSQTPGGGQGTGGARGGQGAGAGGGQNGRGGAANTGGPVGGNGGVNNAGTVGRGGNNAGNNGGNNVGNNPSIATPNNGGDRGGAGWRRFDPSAVNADRSGRNNSGANGRVQTGGQTGPATSNGNGKGGFRGFDSAPQNNGNRGQNTPSVAPSNPAPVQQPRGNGGNSANGNSGWRGFDTAPQNNGNRGQSAPSGAPPRLQQGNAAPVQQQPRGNGGTGNSNGGNNGNSGWRGFDTAPQNNGNRGQQSNPAPVQQQPQQRDFRGFDRGNSGRAPQVAPPPQQQQIPQQREQRRQDPPPSYSRPQQQAPQQPVRISPPIVRERAQAPPPSYTSRPEPQRGGGGGGGGSVRQQAAPAAPSGGGGGGGQRGNSGGGGDRGNRGGNDRGNGNRGR